MKKRDLKIFFIGIIFIFGFLILSYGISATGNNNTTNNKQIIQVPEPSQKALDYYYGNNFIWILQQFLSIVIPLLFLFTKLSVKIEKLAKRIGLNRWILTTLIYILVYSMLTFLIYLPINYYIDFVREHAFGLSNQSFDKYLKDTIMSFFVNLIQSLIIYTVLYFIIKKSPKRWWLYVGILSLPFLILVNIVYPVYIDPLYNNFSSMHNKTLEKDILSLANRAGIDDISIFEVEKSVDTNTTNAYVSGFWKTKRIVIWDTEIQRDTREQLLSVVGHEIGHYRLNHVLISTFLAPIGITFLLFLVSFTLSKFIKKFRKKLGFNDLRNIASLPLIVLLINIFTLIFMPIPLGFSRINEHNADIFSLELTKDNNACATIWVRLINEELIVPEHGLLRKIFRDYHPTLAERINFCNTYRPWETGQKLKYSSLFKN